MKYATPFVDLFRPLTAAEAKSLTESIKVQGVIAPVVVYQSAKHGPAIIDGVNRYGIASELKIDFPIDDRGELDDDVAEELADELNAARRHLTAEDIKAHAAKRRKVVAELRAEGESIRTIAEKVGAKPAAVQRDIDAISKGKTTVSADTVDVKKTKGKDGKTRTAKPKKPPKAKPAAPKESDPLRGGNNFDFGANAPEDDEQRPEILSTPRGEIVIDPFKRVVPNNIGDYFGNVVWPDALQDGEIAAAAIETFRHAVEKAQRTPWLYIDSLKIINRCIDLRNDVVKLLDLIRMGQPYALCAHCEGKKCELCRNTGYVTKGMTDLEPEIYAAHARKAG